MTSDISNLTDAQLKALDEMLTQTHRLYGLLDEFSGHPLLTNEEQQLLTDMRLRAERISGEIEKIDNALDVVSVEEAQRLQNRREELINELRP